MKYYISVIIATALVTYLIRAVPLVLFKKEIKSEFLKDFFYYIPYAVLGAMTFPAILFSTRSIISALAGFLAACVLSINKKGLMVTAIVAALAVYVTEFLMTYFNIAF